MLIIPSFLKPYPNQPDDPPNCENYAVVMPSCFNCLLRRFPIPSQYANPWDEKKTIGLIHSQLEDDQGLIVVKKGETKSGIKYIAAITKTYMGPQYGVQYFLRFDAFGEGEWAEEIGAFLGEEGATGAREATVMGMLGGPTQNWMEDPYDKTFVKGIRMNKAEAEKYDQRFPNHPLTHARKLLRFLIDNN